MNHYTKELSTDFLELPMSLEEQERYYRFFYGPVLGCRVWRRVLLMAFLARIGWCLLSILAVAALAPWMARLCVGDCCHRWRQA